MAPSLRPGWDVLFIARPAIVGADHDETPGRFVGSSRGEGSWEDRATA